MNVQNSTSNPESTTMANESSADSVPASASGLNPRLWLTLALRAAFRCWPLTRRRLWVRNVFRKWCVDEDIVVKTNPGFLMAANPNNYASYGIYFFGEYDSPMTTAFEQLVSEGQTVWDVGTERGWFSCLLAQLVGSKGRVDSFEALPENAARLRHNLALNGMSWVRANELAVSSAIGHATFQLPTAEVVKDYAFLENCSGVGYLTDRESADTIRVPTITLDQYALDTKLESLSLIKMDIEGAEVQALHGASFVLRKLRPIVAVEYNRLALLRSGTSMQELDKLLEELGYERRLYRAGFQKFQLSDWDSVPDHRAVFNVYAFPRESAPS
jgi:FkbM family methyltransferase